MLLRPPLTDRVGRLPNANRKWPKSMADVAPLCSDRSPRDALVERENRTETAPAAGDPRDGWQARSFFSITDRVDVHLRRGVARSTAHEERLSRTRRSDRRCRSSAASEPTDGRTKGQWCPRGRTSEALTLPRCMSVAKSSAETRARDSHHCVTTPLGRPGQFCASEPARSPRPSGGYVYVGLPHVVRSLLHDRLAARGCA